MELQTKSLENVLKVIEKHNHETTIDIQKNKLVIKGISASTTTMWEYVCGIPEQDKEDTFAIKIKELLGAIKGTKNVELTFDDANLIIKTKKRTVKLRMVEVESDKVDFPTPTLTAKAIVNWKDVKESLNAIKAISDENEPSIYFTSGEELTITSKGDLSDFTETVAVTNKGEHNISAKYGLSLLENFTHLSGNITISWGNDFPMLFEQAEDDWFFKAMIAPRIDN